MPPLQPRDHRVTVSHAAEHTSRHRKTLPGKHGPGDHAGSLHADQVLALLAQKGCAALRIYYGRDADGARSLVLVGVTADGKDMVSAQDTVLESVWPCPPFCDPDSPLLV